MTASSGGPIVRDKAHYYAGFERTYRDMTNTFNLTPELVAQVGQPPQPNTVPAYQSVRFFLGKVDYQLAQGHRLTTRVNWFENNNPYNGGAGGTTTIERGFDYKDAMSSTAAQLVSNWGSNRLNELRTQYAAAALPPPVARRRARRHLGDDHQRDLVRPSDVGRRGLRAGHHPDPRQLHADSRPAQLQDRASTSST